MLWPENCERFEKKRKCNNGGKKRVVWNDRYPCVECTRGGVFLVGRQVAVTWRKAQR